MRLKNKQDGRIYRVRTETDSHEGFMIYAYEGMFSQRNFVMHYRSLKDFCDEWEDIEDE